MTLNGVVAVILCYFIEFVSFGGPSITSKWRIKPTVTMRRSRT